MKTTSFLLFIFFAIVASSRNGFAKCDPARTPHGVEEQELWSTTPVYDVGIPTSLAGLASAAMILTDFQSPDTSASAGKQIVGYASLAFNGVPWLISILGECAAPAPVAQVPMSDEERARFRHGLIRGTYWLIGIDTALTLGMFLQADKAAARWVTGLSLPVPLIAALFARRKFEEGPARNKDVVGAGLSVSSIVSTGPRPAGMMQISYGL